MLPDRGLWLHTFERDGEIRHPAINDRDPGEGATVNRRRFLESAPAAILAAGAFLRSTGATVARGSAQITEAVPKLAGTPYPLVALPTKQPSNQSEHIPRRCWRRRHRDRRTQIGIGRDVVVARFKEPRRIFGRNPRYSHSRTLCLYGSCVGPDTVKGRISPPCQWPCNHPMPTCSRARGAG